MALTKVTRSGITDDSINADKIEDGTIVDADITPGTITNAKLAGSIANAKLANSSITVNGSSVSLGGSFTAGSIDWQSVVSGNTVMVAGRGYFVNTTSGAINMTLPSSASAGDTIAIKDYAGTFGSNSLNILRNGHNIQGVANNSEISTNRASVVLVYIDSTKGWLYTNESNVADLEKKVYTAATGGTVATSGDFKIHTFTGDGCFVVSTAPVGPGTAVDYVVVAGGGGGAWDRGGGGGAGGYRESSGNSGPYTASPLATPTGITVTATTFPITVGAGGAGGNSPSVFYGVKGSNSVFSTITSAGGGGGSFNPSGDHAGGSGGGFPGGSSIPDYPPGSNGNVPPVSPPQGNSGGNGGTPGPSGLLNAGGGGGATAVGGNATAGSGGGPGGAGATSSITGSPVTRAGGGGGSRAFDSNPNGSGTSGTGGSGGGGAAAPSAGTNGSSGTANTGGGGGGAANNPSPGSAAGAGGKGVVILRYRFQQS